MSKTFYVVSIVVVPALFTAASLLANVKALALDAAPVRAWSMIASFYGFGVFVLLWYRAWGAIAAGPQKFNPARTALLLLVPLFNLYWFFRAVWGWPKAYNRFVDDRGLSSPPSAWGPSAAPSTASRRRLADVTALPKQTILIKDDPIGNVFSFLLTL